MSVSIADIRRDYQLAALSEESVQPDAIEQFRKWWQEALESSIDEVNAMTLATASAGGVPSARIVLLKGFGSDGFTFYTNYHSYKGMQLEENPRACLVFFWKELERQVRITGVVSKVPAQVSDEYFLSRPAGSRIGAALSPQSQVIPDRQWLEDRFLSLSTQQEAISRPDHWGGYIVQPVTIEFWQGRPSRLHDRIQYTLDANGAWLIERLAP